MFCSEKLQIQKIFIFFEQHLFIEVPESLLRKKIEEDEHALAELMFSPSPFERRKVSQLPASYI